MYVDEICDFVDDTSLQKFGPYLKFMRYEVANAPDHILKCLVILHVEKIETNIVDFEVHEHSGRVVAVVHVPCQVDENPENF